jgi:deoxycytidylate deaminase
MKYLSKDEAQIYLDKAVEAALKSTCERAKCGSVIVKDNKIIGTGFNSPPANKESQRRCSFAKESYAKKITDKTCCIHAEQRAILDSLTKHPDKIKGSRLYFIRLDKNNLVSFAGQPYCTICSKMALDVGVKEFVLLKEEGICAYDTEEYNTLSYEYKEM